MLFVNVKMYDVTILTSYTFSSIGNCVHVVVNVKMYHFTNFLYSFFNRSVTGMYTCTNYGFVYRLQNTVYTKQHLTLHFCTVHACVYLAIWWCIACNWCLRTCQRTNYVSFSVPFHCLNRVYTVSSIGSTDLISNVECAALTEIIILPCLTFTHQVFRIYNSGANKM